jgi:hypothetical protein
MTRNKKVIVGTAVGLTALGVAAGTWIMKKYFPEYIPFQNVEPLPFPPSHPIAEKRWKNKFA